MTCNLQGSSNNGLNQDRPRRRMRRHGTCRYRHRGILVALRAHVRRTRASARIFHAKSDTGPIEPLPDYVLGINSKITQIIPSTGARCAIGRDRDLGLQEESSCSRRLKKAKPGRPARNTDSSPATRVGLTRRNGFLRTRYSTYSVINSRTDPIAASLALYGYW